MPPPPTGPPAHRLEAGGAVRALPLASQLHLLQALDAQGLDHVLHYPQTDDDLPPRALLYLSPAGPTVVCHCLETPRDGELQGLWRWATPRRGRGHAPADPQHSPSHAYRFVRTSVLKPAHNECHTQATHIAQWCDSQIDAFTRYLVTHDPAAPVRKRKAPPAP